LNLMGGDCGEDRDKREEDEGICRIMRNVQMQGLKGRGKRQVRKRWRKQRSRTFPSASTIFRYLGNVHDVAQEKLRVTGHLQQFHTIRDGQVRLDCVLVDSNHGCRDMYNEFLSLI
jgi:hypothetical protein